MPVLLRVDRKASLWIKQRVLYISRNAKKPRVSSTWGRHLIVLGKNKRQKYKKDNQELELEREKVRLEQRAVLETQIQLSRAQQNSSGNGHRN